ncbi:MAG: hypothetical protein H5U07_01850 [Candidatus Aminicenantes bacterium]|nr:hypothetical protein [Candidatus Aminicenantes bacterium]
MDSREIIKRTHRISALIGYAVFAALLLYLVLAELLKAKLAPFHGLYGLKDMQSIKNYRYLFYGLSAASVILARLLQALLLRKKPGDTPLELLNKLHRTYLILVIMSEFPAMFGLILFLLWGLTRDFYILLGISVVVLFIFFPRRQAWEQWLVEKTGSIDWSTGN